ncbi:D-alanyl-D-alanine carboxypeptidase [Streptomyces sp. NBC_01283]|uniref:D-alanyl-D-alanine carboxypeptidase n=1 Tax=Streptomyces sp. NBC_01283 TaxID=2903812 RepID=UPI00352D0507|nr:D-alanyl-D-alanine carboxypeptidase [Streptomyces sp. NBC_01283]
MVRTAGPAVFWRNGNASGMAYEEASVAGETPDRSKQRKSSGNPTGAEPSVPAPAPEERDPRLAVAREVPAAREDQATAVFSTKAVTESKAAGAAGSGSAEGTQGSESGEKGDARLRAAVAAWVASADDEASESSEAAAEGEGAAPGEDATSDDGKNSREAEPSAASAQGSTPADETPADAEPEDAKPGEAAGTGGSSAATAATTDAGDSRDAEEAEGSRSADAAAGEAGSGAGAGDSRDADESAGADGAGAAGGNFRDGDEAAGAAGSSGGAGGSRSVDGVAGDSRDAGEAEGAAGSSGAAAGSRSADAAAGSSAVTAAASDSRDADESAGAGDSRDGDKAAGAGSSTAVAGDSRDGDEPADAAGSTGAADGSRETGESAGAASSSAAAGDARDGDKAASAAVTDDVRGSRDTDAKPSRDEAASEGSDSSEPADAADGTKAETDSDSDDSDTDSDSDSDDSGSDAGTDGKASDKTPEPPSAGVDQATAVFKALPPKAVDQPTTMLKLGDHKPGAKKPEDRAKGKAEDKAENKADAKPEAKPAAKSEGDAERTSKFVALKPLDHSSPSGTTPPAAPAPGAKAPTPEKASTSEKAANVGPERTTQQPLPPRPPLDLLAELTNTPPPPETPVRTAVRRVKIWTPLVLLMVVVFAVVQAVRPLPTPTLTLTAKETVTFEGDKPSLPWPSQGQAAMDVNGIGTFGSSGSQKPVPIASIAKVMTVYLVLRDHPLKKGGDNGPDIPVDAAAQKHYETGKAENESVVKVTEGQKISEYEALQAVMLPSANNVAKLLARWDTKSDSEDEFVAKMNKTAKELGMKNTHYTDPSGLDKTTVSTASDLVKLGRAAMEDPVFNEISRQPSYKDLNGDKQNNFFGLVPTVAIGIKTGTTTAAGGNILFAAEKKVGGETRTIIGAALGQYGQNGTANIDEVTGVTKKLIEAGQGALTSKKIVKKGDVVGEVDDGLGGTTPVVATKDVAAAGWSGLTVKLKLGDKAGGSVPHTAKAGTEVGVLSVGDGKDGAVEVPVALQKDLAEPGFGAKLKRVG